MKYINATATMLFVLTFAATLFAQGSKPQPVQTGKIEAAAPAPAGDAAKGSPAYAELVLRKTELESDLESVLVEYTESYPKVREMRYELTLIKGDIVRILSLPPSDVGKLTLALGKLLVRKASLSTELWLTRERYADNHPDVKRAQRRVDIFESAVRDILR